MLNALFQQAELPAGRILFVHARLKNLKRSTGHDYGRLTALVLEQLQKTQPKAILVPAYTIYSFMMTGVFHRQFSKSEVGRFSEEVRHSSKPHRTPDPMYSVLDLGGYLDKQPKLDYNRTFGDNSLFAHLEAEDAIIVNLDMDGFWSTQVHAQELRHQVDYRFEKAFSGVVYHDQAMWQRVRYRAYVREMGADLSQHPPYNCQRRKALLQQSGLLHSTTREGIDLSWMSAKHFAAEIDQLLQRDKRVLVD